MEPTENQNWEQKLQQLEAELNQTHSTVRMESQPSQPQTASAETFHRLRRQVRDWFDRLPKAGKIAVAAIALVFGFSVLRMIFQLVVSIVSLAAIAGVVYLGYKFFIASDSSQAR